MLSKNEIKEIRALGQKKFRDEQGLFVVEGENAGSPLSLPGTNTSLEESKCFSPGAPLTDQPLEPVDKHFLLPGPGAVLRGTDSLPESWWGALAQ